MVDLIGPYKIKGEDYYNLIILKYFIMIELEIGWSEIVQYNENKAVTIANLVEQTWLCIYSLPTIIMSDPRNYFLFHAFENNIIEK